jgi:hypothetical protein
MLRIKLFSNNTNKNIGMGISLLLLCLAMAVPGNAQATFYGQDTYGSSLYGADIVVDTTPPVVTNTTATTSPYTATTTILSVVTNENATCRYSVTPASVFTDMTLFTTSGGTAHGTSVAVVASSTYTYYVKCQDPSTNVSPDTTIVFSVDPVPADTTPPVVTNTTATTSPSTATSTTLSVSTNEVASCRYSSASGSVFTSMTPFVTTGGTAHRSPVTVMASTSYTYYVKCQDPSANTSADTIVTFTVAPTPSGSTLTQGLLVEYTFDPGTFSGTSVLDVSGNNRTGTVLGVVSTTTGKFGDGALFTASSSIDMGTSIFGLTDRYSVSLWINQASFNTNAAANQIFSRGTNTYPFNIHTIASHLVREVTRTSGSYYLNPNGGVTPGSWVNLIVTYDQGVRKFFINGVQLAGDTVPPGLYWQATSHFYLGSLGSAAGNGFIGSLDDVRLYNRALTSTEATSLANGGS